VTGAAYGSRGRNERRAQSARDLAPAAPPCFSSQKSWLDFVAAAAVAQRGEHEPGPLLEEQGKPVQFDPAWSFCVDCPVSWRSRMLKADRCDPEAVRVHFHPMKRETTGAST
jgi:hypothetical protein